MILYVSFLLSLAAGLGGLVWAFAPDLPSILPFWLSGIPPVLLVVVVGLALAAAWLAAWSSRREWVAAIALVLTASVAALGIYLGLSTLPLLAAVIGALAAWDLAAFNIRLAQAATEDNMPLLVQDHLLWLGFFVLLSGLLGYGALNWRLRLTFEWLAVLVLLGIWGVAQLIRWLRRGGAE